MDSSSKVLSSLSYFSIFFAPFLLPVLVYVLSKEEDVKHHAKRALVSHIVPLFVIIFGIGFGVVLGLSVVDTYSMGTVIISYVTGGLLYVIFFDWNIIQGIKILL